MSVDFSMEYFIDLCVILLAGKGKKSSRKQRSEAMCAQSLNNLKIHFSIFF